MRRILLVAVLTFALAGAQAEAKPFATGKNDHGNSVTFRVSAPLETIVGTSASVVGQFDVDLSDPTRSGSGRFVVDVASFRTGIDRRDEHMRSSFLQTEEYPEAVFTIDRVVSAASRPLQSGVPVELQVEGRFQLHGVSRTEQVTARVTYLEASEATQRVMPGNLLAVDATLRIRLADYDIERPQRLWLKVGEEVDIHVAARMSDASELLSGEEPQQSSR